MTKMTENQRSGALMGAGVAILLGCGVAVAVATGLVGS
jgi:hypothetical protein